MQFHLNGFQPGDPSVAEAAEGYDTRSRDTLEEVDVLIVGAGPAGLTLAAQLSAFPEITTRIIEQKPGRLIKGQADGIACRTMEVFEALGFSERVLKEAYWVNETSFWKPDDAPPETIVRSGRIQDTEDGLSEFPHVILNQARVHDFLLDIMEGSPTRMVPGYARRLVNLTIDPELSAGDDGPTRPIVARIERVEPGHQSEIETVRARYLVGCDGAHSTVRKAVDLVMRGDSANQAWGVMDVLAVTDFPDIRLKTLIRSVADGSLLIIPREGGYLTRIYIELDQLEEGERVADRNITVEGVIQAAQRVFSPYTLDVKEVAWWSVYEIGQRLCDRFDNVPERQVGSLPPHVFVVGDACHTHSPKAGQGMNVAIRDAFNLGWKLAAVLLGGSSPAILRTYSAERRAVAKELIDFDRVFARLMGAPPKSESAPDGVDPVEFERYFARQGRYTAGTTIRYDTSLLIAPPTYQDLAKGLPIGMRFHSAPVIRLADARRVELGHVMKADGRWRLVLFAGSHDPTSPEAPVGRLFDFLAEASASPIRRYTRPHTDVDSVIDVRAVFQQDHRALALEAMPSFLLPRKGRYGLHDYEKMFCPDSKSGRDIFDLRGIARDRGCVVVVRPDQHVAHVLPLEAHAELAAFFDGFMTQSS
jgi:2-polyprenyl-6-methoxyphenol hydroxylase-like FAD-dependent oxidoreductase